MNQNDLVALGLSALVVGGLAIFGRQLASTPAPAPNPNVLPPFPPIPGPTPPPPGTDPQYDAARRAIDTLILTLQTQGGGTPVQREQAAQVLEAQAATLEASRQSPQAVALLRQAVMQLRTGQFTPITPTPNPAPFPFPFPTTSTTPPVGANPPANPAMDLARARAAIKVAERQVAEAPDSRAQVAVGLAETIGNYADATAIDEIRKAVVRITSGTSTGQNAPGSASASSVPTTPSDVLTKQYQDLRTHCADFLQGAREMDHATLGAADRTSTDLLRAGDTHRAADLGALATASYARAGVVRPVPVPA